MIYSFLFHQVKICHNRELNNSRCFCLPLSAPPTHTPPVSCSSRLSFEDQQSCFTLVTSHSFIDLTSWCTTINSMRDEPPSQAEKILSWPHTETAVCYSTCAGTLVALAVLHFLLCWAFFLDINLAHSAHALPLERTKLFELKKGKKKVVKADSLCHDSYALWSIILSEDVFPLILCHIVLVLTELFYYSCERQVVDSARVLVY